MAQSIPSEGGGGSNAPVTPAFSNWHSPNGSGVVPKAEVKPNFGLLTWREEGRESTKNNSRWLHVPGKWSGCTTGRGYDMKAQPGGAGTISADLHTAMSADGSAANIAQIDSLASACSGKSGQNAYDAAVPFSAFELTPTAQKVLFERAYKRKEAYISGVYARALKNAEMEGQGFDALNPAIREVVLDLGYVGQFTPGTQTQLLEAAAANDVEWFRDEVDALDKKGYENRYKSRLKVLDQEIERQKKDQPPPPPPSSSPAAGQTFQQLGAVPNLRNRGQVRV